MKLKALPVKQPWAWLIVNGYKDIENRKNPPAKTRVGEKFAIYASRHKVTAAEYEDFLERVKVRKIKRYPKSVADFDYGCLVGTAVVTGHTFKSKSYWAIKKQCHWILTKVRKMKPKKIRKSGQFWFGVEI